MLHWTGRAKPSSSPLAGRSFWQRHGGAPGTEHDHQRSLPGLGAALPQRVDFAVIGGGLAGLATALALADAEPAATIAVLEARFAGYGASGRNAGLLSPLPAPLWLASADTNAEHRWGLAHLNARVHEIARWLASSVPGSGVEPATLRIEAQGRLTATGLARVAQSIDRAGLAHRIAAGPAGHLAVDLDTHTIDPYRTVQALAGIAHRRGIALVEDTPAQRVEETADAVRIGLRDGRSLLAGAAVVCTNAYTPSLSLPEPIAAKVVYNYMVATGPAQMEALGRPGTEGRFVVELNTAYVYYRIHQGRVVYGGVERFKSFGSSDFAVPPDVLTQLERRLQRSFPHAGLKPAEAWGGIYHQTSNDMPIVKRVGARGAIVLNVGYGGTGVAMSLMCGRLAAALALRERFVDPADRRLLAAITAARTPVAGIARFVARVASDVVMRRQAVVPEKQGD